MSTIAEFQIPAAEFALSETLSAVPHVEFETVRVVAHEADRVLPLVWVQTDDADALDAALAADPTVENVSLLADLAEERLYGMDWVANVETVVHALLEHDGTVLSTSGRADGWHLRILFPDRDSLSATYDFATDAGIDFALRNVLDLTEGRGSQFALTEHQYQALLAAYEHGYYDIPQSVTVAELAEELGVSAQAVSQRLSRAYRNLIENALVIGRPLEAVSA
jgi:predicted DNA binding protein